MTHFDAPLHRVIQRLLNLLHDPVIFIKKLTTIDPEKSLLSIL